MELEWLRIFVKVAEVESFTRAAQRLGVPKSRASDRVAALEASLGVKLLQRTTRTVRLTEEGARFVERARALLADAEELGALFQATRGVRGQVRVDLPITMAREGIIPRLPELFARHPLLELQISTTDQRVEVVRDGFDCVVRVGTLVDSELVARRLGAFVMGNFASPGYIQRRGAPRTLDDLDEHYIVHYSPGLGGDTPVFEHRDGDGFRDRPMRALVTVNGTDAYMTACVAGLGIAQIPRRTVRALVDDGALVEVLPDHPAAPMPVSLLHPHGRRVPQRVRAVLGWLAETVTDHLA